MAGQEDFLSRWSRRKVEARSDAPAPVPALPADRPEPEPAGEAAPSAAVKPPLPDVESLTPESDFAPFMAADVDGGVRRQALKTLFSDPRFNVMDMMDVYVDDYSKPDPIPESWMGKLEQLSRLGDRAGRDREEAERRRALAQEVAEAREEVAGKEPETAAANAGESPRILQAESGPVPDAPAGAEPVGESDLADRTIPPLKVRESGP